MTRLLRDNEIGRPRERNESKEETSLSLRIITRAHDLVESRLCSEGLTLETSAFESLYGG